jgi:hypothetical protein
MMKDPNQAKDVQAISILVQYLAQKVSFWLIVKILWLLENWRKSSFESPRSLYQNTCSVAPSWECNQHGYFGVLLHDRGPTEQFVLDFKQHKKHWVVSTSFFHFLIFFWYLVWLLS